MFIQVEVLKYYLHRENTTVILNESRNLQKSHTNHSDKNMEMVTLLKTGGPWSGDWYDKSCILLFGDTGLGKSTLQQETKLKRQKRIKILMMERLTWQSISQNIESSLPP